MTTADESQPRVPRSLAWRITGAMRLSGAAFEDIELDRGAMGQAVALIVLAGLARGVGAWEDEGFVGLVGSPFVALAVWLSAGVMIWGIGVQRYGYDSDLPELLRTLAFAAAPLLFLALCALPLAGFAVWLQIGAHAWATLALVVAVREALDVPTSRALLVCALALAVTLAVLFGATFLFVAGLG